MVHGVSTGKEKRNVPKSVSVGAALIAGAAEISIFHPVDTVAKRLMSNVGSLSGKVNKVLFKKAHDQSLYHRIMSLYPGLGWAAVYKVSQRGLKMGGQPVLREELNRVGVGRKMQDVFGQKGGKVMTDSVAGSCMGMAEIVLLPLDRLKILSQTNPDVLKGRGVTDLFMKEGFGLYAGAGATAMRNAPGSFFLFGGTAFTREVIFRVSDVRDATLFQNFCASTVGACCSIVFTNPQDVIKTRIQNKAFGEKHTTGAVVRALLRDEGFSAFFKGVTPKVIAAAPKLVYVMTTTEYLVNMYMRKSKPTDI